MEPSLIYISLSIIFLLVIAIFVFFLNKNKRKKKFNPLVGIAFAFIIAGIIFRESRLMGYSLMGIGILFAVIDIIIGFKKDKDELE